MVVDVVVVDIVVGVHRLLMVFRPDDHYGSSPDGRRRILIGSLDVVDVVVVVERGRRRRRRWRVTPSS